MQCSVIICTYNRCEELRKTLATLRGAVLPATGSWELVVVDNHSTDSTRDICRECEGILPIRYLSEPQQGKSFALNMAIAEARGELILLTDDDVDVDPDWILALTDAAARHPEISFFGGKVLSRWQAEAPRWFRENQAMLRSNPRVDLGDAELILSTPSEAWLIGANIAFRPQVFANGMRFREDLGPQGCGQTDGRVGPEEIAFEERLLARGHRGLYVPGAIIYHRDPAYRLTKHYVRRWYVESGKQRVRLNQVPQEHLWVGAPRYLWRELIANALK